jgi:hypothetical protein
MRRAQSVADTPENNSITLDLKVGSATLRFAGKAMLMANGGLSSSKALTASPVHKLALDARISVRQILLESEPEDSCND